jgi:hypothetical protein
MDWVVAQFRSLAGGGVNCQWLLDPDDTAQLFTDPTLMATRATFAIRLVSSAPVNTISTVAMGVIAWDSNTGATPPIPCPDPLFDGDFDWVLRQTFPIPETTVAGLELSTVLDSEYGSQARRRLPTGTGLLVCFASYGVTAYMSADVRCLIKE